jgi:signal transduction histidine kinase/ActR/RegA family two-component response regulator
VAILAANTRMGLLQRLLTGWRSLGSIRHAHRSVTGKLLAVVLLTTTVALLVAGASLLGTDLYQERRAWGTDLETAGSILARATAPALKFHDREGARRDFAALEAWPTMRSAALYDGEGRLYVQYARYAASPSPLRAPAMSPGVHYHGGRLELLLPVAQNGEYLGTIYLQAQYDVLGHVITYLSILGLVMFAGLVGALLAVGWLQNSVTRPLGSMASVARQIIEGREYSLRASKTTDDEFGLVVDAFNNMLAEIQQRTRALLTSEQALRDADRRKDEFLATLAHELRNPLAPIRNAVLILKSPEANEQQREWAREVLARQVQHMSLLLDDLLDVSRVTHGQFELKKEYVELRSVCEVALEAAQPLIEAKQHSLKLTLPATPVTLEVDPLRLAQVISNLLTNAAKYTDPHGHIELAAVVHDGGLVLTVADDGIGLKADSIPGLFTMFSQVDSSADRAQGGLGIGLALVKGLVQLHGGTVEAHSPGVGMGSRFVVRLPATALAPSIEPTAGAAGGAQRTARPAKVLVIDDNRDAADTLSLTLQFRGYRVLTAYSGQQALDIGAREHPQAVLVDVGMPGMDGYEVIRRIRRETWGRHAVSVALTGWGQEQDRLKAAAAGFDMHLTKPVDMQRLEIFLSTQLAREQLAAAERLHAPTRG